MGTGPNCTVQVWDRFGEALYLPPFEFIIRLEEKERKGVIYGKAGCERSAVFTTKV